MDKITRDMRLAQWTSIIHECNNSDMPKKSWMSANDIDEKQFYYWQRRVRKGVFEEIQPSFPNTTLFVELFAPISDAPQGGQPDAILRVGNYVLEIRNTISPVLLQSTLHVMTHA